jgi:hypothetical protein
MKVVGGQRGKRSPPMDKKKKYCSDISWPGLFWDKRMLDKIPAEC